LIVNFKINTTTNTNSNSNTNSNRISLYSLYCLF